MVVPLDTDPHGWLQEEEGLTVMFEQVVSVRHAAKTAIFMSVLEPRKKGGRPGGSGGDGSKERALRMCQ